MNNEKHVFTLSMLGCFSTRGAWGDASNNSLRRLVAAFVPRQWIKSPWRDALLVSTIYVEGALSFWWEGYQNYSTIPIFSLAYIYSEGYYSVLNKCESKRFPLSLPTVLGVAFYNIYFIKFSNIHLEKIMFKKIFVKVPDQP